jgi:hypothetical protein
MLAEFARGLATWRRARFNDDLRDRRNLQSADGIEEFASFVAELPDDEPRLLRLRQLCVRGHAFEPGQQVLYELGRFRFFDVETTLDGFLTTLVDLAEADAGEHGQFGGPQIPGDNPWDH